MVRPVENGGTAQPRIGSLHLVRVALSQLNQTVGDLTGNVERIVADLGRAEQSSADVVVFPELAVTGYPPEDLVLKPQFVRDNMRALAGVATATAGLHCRALVGFVEARENRLYNAIAMCGNGEVLAVYRKRLLPNYAVFDEQRYFQPGPAKVGGVTAGVVMVGATKTGISICEDIWADDGPVHDQARANALVILNVNGSPYHHGKHDEREQMLSVRAREVRTPIVYVNQVGGQDELVFDGSSVVVDAHGNVVCRLSAFEEDFEVVDIDPSSGKVAPARIEQFDEEIDRVHSALVVGTRDYVRKNGFTDVVIGLSGGIDSSLVAAVAVDALGSEHVHGVAMPSRYSSQGSLDDAVALAANLGINHRIISIEPSFSAYLDMLSPSFEGRDADLTEENLQSRCRGTTLMALSNKFGWMVLTTGNKSELAVGYFTIYGDSAGGYSVIKDVFKMQVFELSRRVNERAGRQVIPQSVIDKPPSAELRHDQRDDQSLPPYEELDPILHLYVDGDMTVPEIVSRGHAEDVVRRICRLVDVNEYKRRQCAPGVRLSQKAFGKDRRMPITNGYR
jgi:NAD+ synthase (glutamine-hydrolysing)